MEAKEQNLYEQERRAKRDKLRQLGVDPYTDFPPLAQKLKEMAGVMASGGLPIKAGLSFVPGGIGIAVSSVATVSDARDTLRSKTAAQVIAETRATLLGLGIPDESISRLVENRNYTPADLLIMALALKKLNAENTTAFVDHVAEAGQLSGASWAGCDAGSAPAPDCSPVAPGAGSASPAAISFCGAPDPTSDFSFASSSST